MFVIGGADGGWQLHSNDQVRVCIASDGSKIEKWTIKLLKIVRKL